MLNQSCRRILLFGLFLLIFPVGGCGDDDHWDDYAQPLLVRLTDEETRLPVPGIKAVLMDPDRNLPASGVRVSGADGICNFGNLPGEPHHLMVFGGVEYRVRALPRFQGTAKTRGPGILTGPDKTPPVRIHEALLYKVAPDSLPRIAGRVMDAAAGTPLDRVFVSLSPYLSGYQGGTVPSDDVTLSDGGFQVSQIPFAIHPVSNNLFQAVPLRFTRAGYRPLIWKYDPPNGSHDLDIKGVLLAMVKSSPADTASVSGRVVREGAPAVGVVVGMGVATVTGDSKGAAGAPGWSAVTDEEGRFLIENLPAGSYFMHPGFPLADGAFYPDQPNNRAWPVEAGRITEIPDLTVLYEIDIWSPGRGLAMGAPPDSLHWQPVPGTATYEAHLDGEALPVVATNVVGIPPDMVLTPGLHSWSVAARNTVGEYIGATQTRSFFTLHE